MKAVIIIALALSISHNFFAMLEGISEHKGDAVFVKSIQFIFNVLALIFACIKL